MDCEIPSVTFNTRVRDESIQGDNPYTWKDVTTDDIFKDRKVVVFSLPGAFTPTCSTMQLPGFEKNAQAFYDKGVDDIYVISVNDSFVMNKWAADQKLEHVKVIPDGNGDFTKGMKMDVTFNNRGFGMRSWRYAMVVEDSVITHWFEEPGKCQDSDPDPYGETDSLNILEKM